MTTWPTITLGKRTLADLLECLGGIAAERVLLQPVPGQATEADLLDVCGRGRRLCELVDGVLVAKAGGYRESLLALALGARLHAFVVPRNLGLVSGAGGTVRLFPGLVRMPDVAFTSWLRLPELRVPVAPIPTLAPDLAVEVLGAGNTDAEMARKRREYFDAGVRLVWLVEPDARQVAIFTGPGPTVLLDETDTLDGGDVLPGFTLPLRSLFAELDRQGHE